MPSSGRKRPFDSLEPYPPQIRDPGQLGAVIRHDLAGGLQPLILKSQDRTSQKSQKQIPDRLVDVRVVDVDFPTGDRAFWDSDLTHLLSNFLPFQNLENKFKSLKGKRFQEITANSFLSSSCPNLPSGQ